MALPRAKLRVVDPLAPGVTKPTLLSFPRFMRLSGFLRFAPAIVMLSAAASASFLFSLAPTVRAQCGTGSGETPCPTPSPSPTPVNAFLTLDVTAGGPNTQITVNGGAFLPNEQMSLYWDTPNKVAGGGTADPSGNFVTHVKPFSGDAPGVHRLCASVAPNPCANFSLEGPATSPSPSPSPSESPSPTEGVNPTSPPTASPVAGATLNGFDVISKPPFVFLPIVGAAAIALSLAYWVVSLIRRPRQRPLPAAAVVHRAMRPDYSAGFGTPPPTPAPEPVDASAWPDAPPSQSPPLAAPAEAEVPEAEWGPPVEWGTGSSDWGFPEPPPEDETLEPPAPRD